MVDQGESYSQLGERHEDGGSALEGIDVHWQVMCAHERQDGSTRNALSRRDEILISENCCYLLL